MVNLEGTLPDRVTNIISLLVTVTFVLDIRLPNKWVRAASSGFVEERGWRLSPHVAPACHPLGDAIRTFQSTVAP